MQIDSCEGGSTSSQLAVNAELTADEMSNRMKMISVTQSDDDAEQQCDGCLGDSCHGDVGCHGDADVANCEGGCLPASDAMPINSHDSSVTAAAREDTEAENDEMSVVCDDVSLMRLGTSCHDNDDVTSDAAVDPVSQDAVSDTSLSPVTVTNECHNDVSTAASLTSDWCRVDDVTHEGDMDCHDADVTATDADGGHLQSSHVVDGT